jgi:hypothetical protein
VRCTFSALRVLPPDAVQARLPNTGWGLSPSDVQRMGAHLASLMAPPPVPVCPCPSIATATLRKASAYASSKPLTIHVAASPRARPPQNTGQGAPGHGDQAVELARYVQRVRVVAAELSQAAEGTAAWLMANPTGGSDMAVLRRRALQAAAEAALAGIMGTQPAVAV